MSRPASPLTPEAMRRRQVAGGPSDEVGDSRKHFSISQGSSPKSDKMETTPHRFLLQIFAAALLIGGVYYYAEIYNGKLISCRSSYRWSGWLLSVFVLDFVLWPVAMDWKENYVQYVLEGILYRGCTSYTSIEPLQWTNNMSWQPHVQQKIAELFRSSFLVRWRESHLSVTNSLIAPTYHAVISQSLHLLATKLITRSQ